MQPLPPEIRALHLRMLVDALPSLGKEPEHAIRRRAAPWVLERIARAGALDWLPAEFMVEICEAARAEVGDEALEAWGAALLEGTLRGSLMGGFYEAARALTHFGPATVLKVIPHGWPLLYRGCGDLVVTQVSPSSTRIVHTPVPALIRRPATLLPLLGAIRAIPARFGFAAQVKADWSPDSPLFVYAVEWTEARSP